MFKMHLTIPLTMTVVLQLLYGVSALLVLTSYNIILSLVSFLIPRSLRKKKNIKGQRVLITGAGSGVGRLLAIEFSRHATSLLLVDIDRESLLQTEKLLDSRSLAFLYDCDVSDYKKVYEMAKQVKKDVGDVDILVNNAGIVNGKFFCDLPEEKIIKTMQVNALAHFWMCKAFLPGMVNKNHGHIVSVISLAGKIGGPKLTDYCASKYAALGFAESLETELRRNKVNGVKITTVCPFLMGTSLFKGAEWKFLSMMDPEYVAKEIVAGVLENEEMIILPHYLKLPLILKDLSPRWIVIKMMEILDFLTMMDNFVEKAQSENGIQMEDKTSKKE